MAKVTAKKKCCKDKPRCSTCPVVLKRLSDQGFAERINLRKYKMTGKPKKADLAAARTR
jgi:hypothetical protein